MIIKTCVDCGAVILSNNVTARRCPVCAERFAERVRKKYKNPPADPLTADVRKAVSGGKVIRVLALGRTAERAEGPGRAG